jgi:hypothetical protein
MSKGARPSDIARKLLEQQGVLQRAPRPRAGAAPAAAATAVAEEPAVEAAPAADQEQP